MPKEIAVGSTETQTIASKLTGGSKKSYEVKSGKQLIEEPASFNVLVYGEMGTGKTKIVIDLLLLGLKVQMIDTDFGGLGPETIRNYFIEHSEHLNLYQNNFRVVNLDVEGLMAFCRNPQNIIPDIYEWGPDVLFWDGVSSYQQGELEASLCDDDFKRDDADFSTWRGSRNGTIFPMMRFLKQHNIVTGKPWSKVITLLEDERVDRRKSASKAEKKEGTDIIPGSETKGPMLNTTARELAGAGFSIVLRCVKQTIGRDVKYIYQTSGKDIIVKDRYGLPASLDANFGVLYTTYIEPKIKGSASK